MNNKIDKVAVILNTNQLGGAERSLVEQFSIIQNKGKFTFFIPSLHSSDDELVTFLQTHQFTNIKKFYYPKFIYVISRTQLVSLLVPVLLSPCILGYIIYWFKIFSGFSIFYLNGNKSSFPIFSVSLLLKKDIKIFWHFRDFPAGIFFKVIRTLLVRFIFPKKNITLELIANSISVKNKLCELFPTRKVRCIYNLTGKLPAFKKRDQIKTIGVVSMLAPWKGLHTIVLMLSLYEKELRELGIEGFHFFGEGIYQTDGAHNDYAKELKELSSKFKISYSVWAGKKDPSFIFSHIDLLIHASLEPEPFGRVIAESFKSGVIVLSTAIGGAKELIGESERGLNIYPYDYAGLFEKIRQATVDPKLRRDVTSKADVFINNLEKEVISDVMDLFT